MTVTLQVFELLSLILGLIVVFITYRAGAITGQRYLYHLSMGFAIISLSSFLEEVFSSVFEDFSLRVKHLLESIVVNIGLIVIIYSLKESNVPLPQPEGNIEEELT